MNPEALSGGGGNHTVVIRVEGSGGSESVVPASLICVDQSPEDSETPAGLGHCGSCGVVVHVQLSV
jgi:hypothetical protein